MDVATLFVIQSSSMCSMDIWSVSVVQRAKHIMPAEGNYPIDEFRIGLNGLVHIREPLLIPQFFEEVLVRLGQRVNIFSPTVVGRKLSTTLLSECRHEGG